MALVSQSDVEARLKRSMTAEEVAAFGVINTAMQALVERIIGSKVESVDPTTRYFDGGKQHLRIDPCTDITSVELVDDDQVSTYTYDTTDYTKEPFNNTVKTMLRHRNSLGFVHGIRNIAVTAKFSINGDAGTLGIVKDALLSAIVSELQNSQNIVKESIEGYSVEYMSSEAKMSLASIYYLFPEV